MTVATAMPIEKLIEVNGELLVPSGDAVLVASRSEIGTWHAVVNGCCDCKSFHYRRTCRHADAVAEWKRRNENATCPKCGKALQPGRTGTCAKCLLTVEE